MSLVWIPQESLWISLHSSKWVCWWLAYVRKNTNIRGWGRSDFCTTVTTRSLSSGGMKRPESFRWYGLLKHIQRTVSDLVMYDHMRTQSVCSTDTPPHQWTSLTRSPAFWVLQVWTGVLVWFTGVPLECMCERGSWILISSDLVLTVTTFPEFLASVYISVVPGSIALNDFKDFRIIILVFTSDPPVIDRTQLFKTYRQCLRFLTWIHNLQNLERVKAANQLL